MTGEVSVNGVVVDTAEFPTPQAAAVRELLRQRAILAGLLADGASTEEVDAAIERLLDREVTTPEPTDDECRRYYDAHPELFVSGELVAARHILFQVTESTSVAALRARAESTLAELLKTPERFDTLARECSNCPSAQHGGNLGQVQRGETVPEFERALFNGNWVGIRGQLVRSRYGFHIVAVDRRAPANRHLSSRCAPKSPSTCARACSNALSPSTFACSPAKPTCAAWNSKQLRLLSYNSGRVLRSLGNRCIEVSWKLGNGNRGFASRNCGLWHVEDPVDARTSARA